MKLQEKAIVSSVTLIASLSAYYFAKQHHKDPVPFIMVGTFVGAWAGEVISNQLSDNSKDNDNGSPNNK